MVPRSWPDGTGAGQELAGRGYPGPPLVSAGTGAARRW
jgi:hypothetical protein